MIKRRTQLANAIRGFAAEFGVTAATGMCRIEPLLETIAADETIPALARELFALHAEEYGALKCEIELVEEKLMAWHRSDERRRVTFAAFPWRWKKGDGCIVRLVAIVDPTGNFRIETGADSD